MVPISQALSYASFTAGNNLKMSGSMASARRGTNENVRCRAWECVPIISVLWRLRQEDS